MRLQNSIVSAIAATLLLANATTACAGSNLVDVQFSNYYGAQQTGAAVQGTAGDYWNDFIGSGTGSGALLTTSGDASGINLSFSSALVYSSAWNYTQFTFTPYDHLMNGYLVGNASTDINLTFTGLTANQLYGFWIYTQGDDNSAGRQISLTTDGGASAVATQTNTNSLTLGDNYVYIVSRANAFGAIDIVGHDLNGEANVNGVQLMTVPEPATLPLLAAGLVFVAAVARRKRSR